MFLASSVNFAGSWTTLWSKISGSLGVITNWLAIAGMLMVLAAAVKYILDRRKSQRGNHIGLILTVVVGMILSSPGTMIGYVLGFIDSIANIVVHAFGG